MMSAKLSDYAFQTFQLVTKDQWWQPNEYGFFHRSLGSA